MNVLRRISAAASARHLHAIPIRCFSLEAATRTNTPRRRLPMPKRQLFHSRLYSTPSAIHASSAASPAVTIPIDGRDVDFSAILIRDACACPLCVHTSTQQRLFSVADVPSNIQARSVDVNTSTGVVSISWENDAHGFPGDHVTNLNIETLRGLDQSGAAPDMFEGAVKNQVLWHKHPLPSLPDYDYDAYMNDDAALQKLLDQLRVDGLAFVTNVPGTEAAASDIAKRIGPVKESFYGYVWDVRTVPDASNAAYTSGGLGFHTDLLYFKDPPHVQLLHCVQSASTGGASVFADGYKAALDLFHDDVEAFNTLATIPVNYHYTHPDSNVYRTTKAVIDLLPLRIGGTTYTHISDYIGAWNEMYNPHDQSAASTDKLVVGLMQKINWGPPFLAPFSNHEPHAPGEDPLSVLNDKVERWHGAAQKYNALLQRPAYLYERTMKSGECVLFDNTRTLHSRRAFEKADVGKPRWLRGTYVDRDAYLSSVRVLNRKYGGHS